MLIKICGLFKNQDIDYVNEALPDFVGFVFTKSKRQIGMKEALYFKQRLNSSIQTVGVFVNQEISTIKAIVDMGLMDYIQLHSQESLEYIKLLKEKINKPIIKAITIDKIDTIKEYVGFVDCYLIDGPRPGSGETYDWNLLKGVTERNFLTGGINQDNIQEACLTGCIGIDISSGVETNGVKDINKIKHIVGVVRNAKG